MKNTYWWVVKMQLQEHFLIQRAYALIRIDLMVYNIESQLMILCNHVFRDEFLTLSMFFITGKR